MKKPKVKVMVLLDRHGAALVLHIDKEVLALPLEHGFAIHLVSLGIEVQDRR